MMFLIALAHPCAQSFRHTCPHLSYELVGAIDLFPSVVTVRGLSAQAETEQGLSRASATMRLPYGHLSSSDDGRSDGRPRNNI